jgi:FtsZ-binding cell division protein ZapB
MNRYSELIRDLEFDTKAAIDTHLAFVWIDLDTLKDENIALESDRDPGFRERVENEVEEIEKEMGEIATS